MINRKLDRVLRLLYSDISLEYGVSIESIKNKYRGLNDVEIGYILSFLQEGGYISKKPLSNIEDKDTINNNGDRYYLTIKGIEKINNGGFQRYNTKNIRNIKYLKYRLTKLIMYLVAVLAFLLFFCCIILYKTYSRNYNCYQNIKCRCYTLPSLNTNIMISDTTNTFNIPYNPSIQFNSKDNFIFISK